MNTKDLNARLYSKKIGGFLDRSRRLFDEEYADIDLDDMKSRVSSAVEKLRTEGLDPPLAYHEDDADCDNFALWIQSEVTKQWAKEKHNKGAIPFGPGLVPGHELNIGVTRQGIFAWNYGQFEPDFDLSKIKEVEFK
jgi:hypothetical protein